MWPTGGMGEGSPRPLAEFKEPTCRGKGGEGRKGGNSSIAGTKMIPFASYKAPQTQSRPPSPTK